ncbi:MAG: putative ABC transporter permease, partial [Actinomycetota bacterium]|nr:putative ABC transporter permease [Actinomycetota bacterium]
WMVPIYALIQPLYEPLHNNLRNRPLWVRALSYAAGFFLVEYGSGYLIRSATGEAPWDYSDARWNMDGLVRPDYVFFWAAAGVALEPLHDRVTKPPPPRK